MHIYAHAHVCTHTPKHTYSPLVDKSIQNFRCQSLFTTVDNLGQIPENWE